MRPLLALLLAVAPLRADGLLDWLNLHAQRFLSARAAAVDGLKTRAGAEARQKQIRDTLLRLAGGVPEYSGPRR